MICMVESHTVILQIFTTINEINNAKIFQYYLLVLSAYCVSNYSLYEIKITKMGTVEKGHSVQYSGTFGITKSICYDKLCLLEYAYDRYKNTDKRTCYNFGVFLVDNSQDLGLISDIYV